MLILGFYGGPNTEFEVNSPTQTHDGAAVLLKDGEVIAAIEEERLNRIKHSYTAPLRASRFVMAQAGVTLADIDHIAIPYLPEFAERLLRRMYLADPSATHSLDVTDALRAQWRQYLGADVSRERVRFVPHHIAHATATFEMSGFDEALVMTIDGQGETESGMVLKGSASGMELLHRVPIPESLGHFYWQAIGFLGYRLFDEYKVMGLAPYGDPQRFRPSFDEMCRLLPEGRWQLRPDLLESMYAKLTPRRKGEPVEQIHKDFAAALQEMLERAVLHSLEYFRSSTGLRNLCLSGGVAHNCTMNGNILRSGLFDNVFVHPAAHDGGNALGAALSVHRSLAPASRPLRLRSIYWGTPIGRPDDVEASLRAWSDFVEITRSSDVEEDTAGLIADGKVVGWVQGRSEFGPRALGNRSILADPRPPENKRLINKMVKTRESFRPFAPAVLEEEASDYFELPGGETQFPFMTFVLNVQPDKRELLGAVTHVDGTARIQTVSRTENPRFWSLIDAFRRRTGIPVVLNTSFNNNVEPIVDSVDDAVACFLTTGLQALVVGDFIMTKKDGADRAALVPELPNHVRLLERRQRQPDGEARDLFELGRAVWNGEVSKLLPGSVFALLKQTGEASIAELTRAAGLRLDEVMPVMEELWAERCLVMRPRASSLMPNRETGTSAILPQHQYRSLDDVVLSKNATLTWHELEGSIGLPLLVIDNALEDPHRVREAAWNSRFHLPGPNEYYPGWQASAQMSGEKRLIQDLARLFLDRLWSRGWPPPLSVSDLVPHSTFSVFGMDHAVAARNGYIDQHVDTYSWIAVVTYLFEHDDTAGADRGTAFWKHRPTDLQTFFLGDLLQASQIEHLFGLKFIDDFRKASVRLRATNMQEAQKQILENPDSARRLFSLEEDSIWKLLEFVPARFNRLVAYPTWRFHSIVDTSDTHALSTRNARLTYNTFIPYPVPARLGPQSKYQGGGYASIDGMRIA